MANAPEPRTDRPSRDPGGASVLLLAVVLTMMGVVVAAVAAVGADLVDRQRAQVAADGAALAGAQGGRAAAHRAAGLNGAEIVEVIVDGRSCEVIVAYGGQTARARATSEP